MNSIANSDAIKLVFDVGYFQIVQDVYNSILRSIQILIPHPSRKRQLNQLAILL